MKHEKYKNRTFERKCIKIPNFSYQYILVSRQDKIYDAKKDFRLLFSTETLERILVENPTKFDIILSLQGSSKILNDPLKFLEPCKIFRS